MELSKNLMDPSHTNSDSEEDEVDLKKPTTTTTLTNEQIRKVAKMMYYQGAQSIHSMKFRSLYERIRYLNACKNTYMDTVHILNTTESATKDLKDIPQMAPIVRKYASYVKGALGFAHKAITALSTRAQYIANLKRCVFFVLNDMLNTHFNEAKIAALEKEINVLCKIMVQYEATITNPALRKFSRSVRALGVTFPKLLRRFQTVLGFTGRFSKLAIGEKIQVLEKVTQSLGGKVFKYGAKTLEVLDKYGAKALYGLTALVVAVDIYSANPDERYETAVKDVVTLGSAILFAELSGFLYIKVALPLLSTGNPYLIAAGIAVGFVVYFGGNALENYVQTHLMPPVIGFMNTHKPEVIYGLEIITLSFLSKSMPNSILANHCLQVGLSTLIFPGAALSHIILAMIKPKSSAKPKPKPPISTFGFIVRGPQVPNARLLVQRIACKA